MKRLPRIFRNFYFISTLVFLAWLLLADKNDLFSQIKLYAQVSTLEAEKEEYQEKISRLKWERKALLEDDNQLEKLAREKYFMKKPGEDIFVIEPKP
jgi:cell division protein DivIC